MYAELKETVESRSSDEMKQILSSKVCLAGETVGRADYTNAQPLPSAAGLERQQSADTYSMRPTVWHAGEARPRDEGNIALE